MNGRAWYREAAAVPVAQAIGRAVRHAGDFGLAVLIDARWGTPYSEGGGAASGGATRPGMRDKLPRYVSIRAGGAAPVCVIREVMDRDLDDGDVREVRQFFMWNQQQQQ